MLHRTPAGRPGHRTLTFQLPADHPAGRTSVVGNFNDWTPGALLLEPDGHGMKSATVVLPSSYIAVFRYLGEGDWWFDEPEADFVDGGGSVVVEHVDAESLMAEDADLPVTDTPVTDAAAAVPQAAGVPSPAERAEKVARKHVRKSEKAAQKAVEKARRKASKLRERAAKAEDKRRKELAKGEEKRARELARTEQKSAKRKAKAARGAAASGEQ